MNLAELKSFVEDNFEEETIRAIKKDINFTFSGIGKYQGSYENLNGKDVLSLNTNTVSIGVANLFFEVLLPIVNACLQGEELNEKNFHRITQKVAWIKETPQYPNLNTYESYYFAVAKAICNKLSDLEAQTDIDRRRDYINSLPEKDRKAFINARNGHGRFRNKLIEHWEGKCSVTECKMTNVLIASHIKPWRDCNIEEALDHLNGLLLMPNLDALFDKGFISFDDNGKIIISSQLSNDDLKKLGVNVKMKLQKTPNEQRKIYLEYHRENIFQE